MSEIDTIIEAAANGTDLGLVLRRCKVLAAKLGSNPLEDWLKWESNGYPSNVEVPDYRQWPVTLKGHFRDDFGRLARNAPIPLANLPENVRRELRVYNCRQSIASIEVVLNAGLDPVFIDPGDLSTRLDYYYEQGLYCADLRIQFGKGHLVEVINTVRNRVLEFLLVLRKASPDAGDESFDSPRIEPSRVTQLFHVEVMHGNINSVGEHYEAGQAGAMGPGAHAHDMTFQQIWNEVQDKVDFDQIKKELATLREAMQERATEPEHRISVANFEAAEKAAESGNGPKMMEFIRGAGTWGMEVAQQVSTQVSVQTVIFLMQHLFAS